MMLSQPPNLHHAHTDFSVILSPKYEIATRNSFALVPAAQRHARRMLADPVSWFLLLLEIGGLRLLAWRRTLAGLEFQRSSVAVVVRDVRT